MLERLFASAGGIALFDGLCTIIGSVIMGREKLNPQLNVVLAGGVVAGFSAGMLLALPQIYCPIKEDSSLALKLGIAAFDIVIVAGALLVAPLTGENIAHAGTNWSDVVTDTFVGAAVLGGGVATILGTVYLGVKCSSGFFSKSAPEPAKPQPAALIATPGNMV